MRAAKMVKALFALWLSFTSIAQAQEVPQQVQLGLDQARQVAIEALRSGQPRLAFALSDGLLQANPEDGHAHYMQAQALAQLNEYDEARKKAAKAYRTSNSDIQLFESATLAAQLSIAGQRYTHSQIWLRRAVHYAPDETQRDIAVAAFQEARNRNPLNVQLSFAISPSDNVNNGSNTPFNIIDGIPQSGGIIAPRSQAIAGWSARFNAHGSYRFRQRERNETRIVASGLAYRVEFNNPVEGISASELASQRFSLGVSHIWLPGENGFWRFNGNGGRTWLGGDPFYNFASVSVQKVRKLNENWRMSFGAAVERQDNEARPISDATVYFGSVGLTHSFAGGSKLNFTTLFRETVSDNPNLASTQWSGILKYTHGRKIGPAKISVSLGNSTVDYDGFIYPAITTLTGLRGRTDTSWFGEISAKIDSVSYMGFVPVVSLKTEQTNSNSTLFDVDQTGISIGVQSEF